MVFKAINLLAIFIWIMLIITILSGISDRVHDKNNYDREVSYPQYPVRASVGGGYFTIIDEGAPDNNWTIKFPEGPPPHDGMYLGWICDDNECEKQH